MKVEPNSQLAQPKVRARARGGVLHGDGERGMRTKTAPLAGFSREKEAKAMAQSEAKKRKQPEAPVQMKQCDTCRAFRKVPGDQRKGWSCPDLGYSCKKVWQCWKCGYADKRDGAPPEGWSCPSSGRKCLPMPKKGFPKPPPQ